MLTKRRLRIISQGLFFILFLFLFIQTESKGNDTLGYPVRLFLDFDPLIFLTTVLAAHSQKIPAAFFLSLILVLITIALGRVFCGWICPLGTIHNLIGSVKKKGMRRKFPVISSLAAPSTDKEKLEATASANWHKTKYYILLILLASSFFTLQLAGIMDPISFLIRSFSLSVYPLLTYGIRGTFDAIYQTNIPGLVPLSEAVYDFLKKTLLPFRQPHYLQAVFIGAIFFTILILNLKEHRFWCKYLCPLGALLGILSRYSILKREVSEGCTSCGLCTAACQGATLLKESRDWQKTECLACFACDDICPQKAVSFGFGQASAHTLDLGRRQVVLSLSSGVVAVPLIRSTPFVKPNYSNPAVLRPPGALAEEEFLRRCVKCGECMKVCITNGLQPALLETGLEGIWSPRLVPRIGYCEYRCTLCGQVCPSGAIKRLPLEEKMQVKLGLAMVDKGRCLPYAHATPCIVCEEVCPTPKKAIWLEEVVVKDRNGKTVTVKQPHIDLELCIGCGICEAKCPVGARAAIYVTNIGESRSTTNQLLLS